MRTQIVPLVLVVILSVFMQPAFATASDDMAKPTADEPKAGASGYDKNQMANAIDLAAKMCERLSNNAAKSCSTDNIKVGKAKDVSGLATGAQDKALKSVSEQIERQAGICTNQINNCARYCNEQREILQGQCRDCGRDDWEPLTDAMKECDGNRKLLAKLEKHKGEVEDGRRETAAVADKAKVAGDDIIGKRAPPETTGSIGDNNSPGDLPKCISRGRGVDGGASSRHQRVADSRDSRPDPVTRPTHGDAVPTADRAPTHQAALPAAVDLNGDGHLGKDEIKKFDLNGDGKLSAHEMKVASLETKTPGDHSTGSDANTPPSTSTPGQQQQQPQSTADDNGKAERRAERREARRQNEMQQQMQAGMMQQQMQQLAARMPAQQAAISQQKQAMNAQQAQALIAATIAQQNALAATLAANQAARAPSNVGQATFAPSLPMPKKATLAPATQAVNAVSERPVIAGQAGGGGGMRVGGGSEWTPTGAVVTLAATRPYDPAAHTNASQLNQRPFGAEAGGGAGGPGGGKARKGKAGDGKPMSVTEMEEQGGPAARQVAGLGNEEMGIQSSAVDIWGLVSQRFQAHCSAGRLKDCR